LPLRVFSSLRSTDERLDPHFLQAYLDCAGVRTWLGDLARGAVVQHLRPAAIDELPVPLPPLAIQHLLADDYREHQIDVLRQLLELNTDAERDPVADWAAKALRDYRFPEDTTHTRPLDLAEIDRFANDVRYMRNRAAHAEFSSAMTPWLSALSEALQPLRGVHRIPRGPSLFGILQETSRNLNSTERLLTNRLPEAATARRLTRAITWQLQCWRERLLSQVVLNLAVTVDELDAGTLAEIGLEVGNAGSLPLREILLITTPDWGSGEIDFLSGGQTTRLSLRGNVPSQLGPFVIKCEWGARLIDGRPAEGTVEIPIRSVERVNSLPKRAIHLASSPYMCGDPVRPDRNDVFFGREELIDDIRRQVVRSGNVILLEGNRRAGKSSILRHLEGLEPIPGWLGVYSSLQGAEGSPKKEGVPTVEVFREIAKSIASGLRVLGRDVPLPNGTMLLRGQNLGIANACRLGISIDAPFSDLREYLETALAFLDKEKRGLLLMLDEFDKLQEGIENEITSLRYPIIYVF
jgi:type I restriction enzyme M protein